MRYVLLMSVLLSGCAPSMWRECYEPGQAFSGIEIEGYPYSVEWCADGQCYPTTWYIDVETLYVHHVSTENVTNPMVCIVWADE